LDFDFAGVLEIVLISNKASFIEKRFLILFTGENKYAFW